MSTGEKVDAIEQLALRLSKAFQAMAGVLEDAIEKDRLDQAAREISNDEVMTVDPEATEEELKSSGLTDARNAVIAALKTRESRIEEDLVKARELLKRVGESLIQAQTLVSDRKEIAKLDLAARQLLQPLQSKYSGHDLEAGVREIETNYVVAAGEHASSGRPGEAKRLLGEVAGACLEFKKLAEKAETYAENRKVAVSAIEEVVTYQWHQSLTSEIDGVKVKLEEADRLATYAQKGYGDAELLLTEVSQDCTTAKQKADGFESVYVQAKSAATLRISQLDTSVTGTPFTADAGLIRTNFLDAAVREGETERNNSAAVALLGQVNAECGKVAGLAQKSKDVTNARPTAESAINGAKSHDARDWTGIPTVKDEHDKLDELLQKADERAEYAEQRYDEALTILNTTIPTAVTDAKKLTLKYVKYETKWKSMKQRLADEKDDIKDDDDFKDVYVALKNHVSAGETNLKDCKFADLTTDISKFDTKMNKMYTDWNLRLQYNSLLETAEDRVQYLQNQSWVTGMDAHINPADAALTEAKNKRTPPNPDFQEAIVQLGIVSQKYTSGLTLSAPNNCSQAETKLNELKNSAPLKTHAKKSLVNAKMAAEISVLEGKVDDAKKALAVGAVVAADRLADRVYSATEAAIVTAQKFADYFQKRDDEVKLPNDDEAIRNPRAALVTKLQKADAAADKRHFVKADELLDELKAECPPPTDFLKKLSDTESLVPDANDAINNQIQEATREIEAAKTSAGISDFPASMAHLVDAEAVCKAAKAAVDFSADVTSSLDTPVEAIRKIEDLVLALERRTPEEIVDAVDDEIKEIKANVKSAKEKAGII